MNGLTRNGLSSLFKRRYQTKTAFSFEQPDNDPPLNKAIHFYHHEQDWTNRLIAGDSLLVMNSLLKKRAWQARFRCFISIRRMGLSTTQTFSLFVNKRDVKDGNDGDIPAEPEMIQAFRDTWELGIHSYLTYLRERLLLAKELLHESGSCFVQISDENVHHVREIMDEVFGNENFVSLITFSKTSGQSSILIPAVSDYLLWYCKEKKELNIDNYLQQK